MRASAKRSAAGIRGQRKRKGLPSFSQHPELRASLVELVERQQYSLTDVAMFFGVSKERVRQWCAREGVRAVRQGRSGLRGAIRVWDDALNQFRPHSRGAYNGALRAKDVAKRQAIRRFVRAGYRAHMVTAIAACAARLGRIPTRVEQWEAVSGHRVPKHRATPALVGSWRRGSKQTVAEALREMRTAGIPTRPRGWAGHAPKLPLARVRTIR